MLSILKNAEKGSITYYVGDNPSHILHLSDCTLYCKKEFDGLYNVNQIVVDNPQLEFYKLSHTIPNEYTFHIRDYQIGYGCNIDTTSVIGGGVVIGNNVTIGPNVVIYSKTKIGDGTRIDANCTIGSEGMMWAWDGDTKVFLKQLGGVDIGNGCIIGSNSVIVRGSANENTIIEDGVNMAPGCCIGHGTHIGENTHLANNITIGGSVYIHSSNFIGCAAVINPTVKITTSNVVVGGGSLVRKDITHDGVYVGNPLKLIKSIEGKLKGIPTWKIQ